MRWMVVAAVLLALGCGGNEDGTHSDGGTPGDGGTGGSAGTGGTQPPPPPSVDQTCRDWCANEEGGISCHQGPPESIQDCYEQCFRDYQGEAAESDCEGEWIAIKDCVVDLDCNDLFGDCDSVEGTYGECRRIWESRQYCEANCPELSYALCEQDRALCEADGRCAMWCTSQDRAECTAQILEVGWCYTGGLTPDASDQCLNDADQTVLFDLDPDGGKGPAIVGQVAYECLNPECSPEVGGVLSDSSEAALNALGDCIAVCTSTRTGLSMQCTSCYGWRNACAAAFCTAPCVQDPGSEECADCALANCGSLDYCTGL